VGAYESRHDRQARQVGDLGVRIAGDEALADVVNAVPFNGDVRLFRHVSGFDFHESGVCQDSHMHLLR